MRLLPVLIAALIFIPYATATYITINAQMSEIYANGNATQAKFTVSNTGDETAFAVQMALEAEGVEAPVIFYDKLEPGKQVDTSFTLNLTRDLSPGRYPILIVTEYADANNYPFSAVSSSFIVYKERTSSDVNGFFDELQVPKGGSAKARLTLINRASDDRDVNVSVFVPRELFAGRYDKNVLIKPGEKKSGDIEISSLAALQGSTYTVFAIIEYEDQNKHYSSFSRGLVRITKDEGIFSNITVIAAVVVLIAVVFAYNFRARKR